MKVNRTIDRSVVYQKVRKINSEDENRLEAFRIGII